MLVWTTNKWTPLKCSNVCPVVTALSAWYQHTAISLQLGKLPQCHANHAWSNSEPHACLCGGWSWNWIPVWHCVIWAYPLRGRILHYAIWTILLALCPFILTGFSINQGDHGELLVATFFTQAHDQAIHEKLPQFCSYFSVHELFSSLFTDSTFKSILNSLPSLCHTEMKQPFREVSENANMHFNHMIKPQVHMLLACQLLLYYMSHGAATLGANC